MKKLRLDLDELKVESFHTTPDGKGGEGTIFAFNDPYTQSMCLVHTDCPDCTAPTCYPTCSASCGGTCVGPTCDGGHTCTIECAQT